MTALKVAPGRFIEIASPFDSNALGIRAMSDRCVEPPPATAVFDGDAETIDRYWQAMKPGTECTMVVNGRRYRGTVLRRRRSRREFDVRLKLWLDEVAVD